MSDDALIATTLKVATWNVWANFGPWRERYPRIEAALRGLEPDIVCLQEAWRDADHDATADLATRLGYHHAAAVDWFEPLKVDSGAAILSRWEIERWEKLSLEPEDRGVGGLIQFAQIAGPRGPVQVFNAMLDWRPDLGHVRERQVKRLGAWIRERRSREALVVLCGDFNAPPDSDEIRMLTGKRSIGEAGLVFYDAWECLRPLDPGFTWSNANPFAAAFPLPDRRIDYVFSAWGGRRGLGQPVACERIDHEASPPASDHHGVLATLRY